jgi:thiamine biosynthesis protein ThiS
MPNARAYAVEVNRAVVARREHATRTVAAGDRVEIVTLVGGG